MWNRPLTLLLIVCVMCVIVGLLGAVMCHNSKDQENCLAVFDWPIMGLSSLCCAIVCVALVYVEFGMGHRTGVGNYVR